MELKLEDVFKAGFGGNSDVIYQYMKDMVELGYYENNREYLLHKLEVIEIYGAKEKTNNGKDNSLQMPKLQE